MASLPGFGNLNLAGHRHLASNMLTPGARVSVLWRRKPGFEPQGIHSHDAVPVGAGGTRVLVALDVLQGNPFLQKSEAAFGN